jgi:hypothetical protein
MYAVNETSLCIGVRKVISDLLLIREDQRLIGGLSIYDKKGLQWMTTRANEMLHELLGLLLFQDPSLFPSHILLHDDILAKYHAYRSFKRASDSRVIAKEMAITDIWVVNCLQKVEKAQSQHPSYDTMQRYAQVNLLIYCFLRYTMVM